MNQPKMGEQIQTQASSIPPSDKPANQSSSSSQQQQSDHKQVPPFYGFTSPNGDLPMFPAMYPVMVPAIVPPQQGQEQTDHGAGIYMVPTFPNSFVGPITGFPSNALIPFTYNVPTGPSPSEAGTQGEQQGQAGQQQQQAGQQRQVVVRRFQIAIHLDLMLLFKLAAVIFLFNQDGSKKRLVLLIFFASLIYLYQTGALAPLIRWLSQGMQRAAAPPQQPRAPAVRADNIPAAARQENENAPLIDGQAGAENENRAMGDGNEEGAVNGNNNRWWGILKEIQLIVFGFITSLLPGFHNID
ncbi:hypothetical protein QVD17_27828 [Tagetes erecta]|uniref:Transmembrane protein n=1 Tax=Tagetes erecta TaxID=13708 RepID=A0AAD8NRQ3_TARER|nr:hypothetical protein QVD17_27828 [Tagetes erecta]